MPRTLRDPIFQIPKKFRLEVFLRRQCKVEGPPLLARPLERHVRRGGMIALLFHDQLAAMLFEYD